jgi:hypothetical protein
MGAWRLIVERQSRIRRRAARNRQKSANMRAHVKHLFGHQQEHDGRQDRAHHRIVRPGQDREYIRQLVQFRSCAR